METKKKEQNTKAEAETFAATVKGMPSVLEPE